MTDWHLSCGIRGCDNPAHVVVMVDVYDQLPEPEVDPRPAALVLCRAHQPTEPTED